MLGSECILVLGSECFRMYLGMSVWEWVQLGWIESGSVGELVNGY